MALRVGIDLVAIESIEEALAAHGDRYLERVYTEHEVAGCRTARGLACTRLATCFAAKEATMKVLRPSDDALPWRTVELRRRPGAQLELALGGAAAELARAAGLGGFQVSVSHDGGFASAVVVATYP